MTLEPNDVSSKRSIRFLEEVPRSRLYISALTIGLSYFIGGLIPLIPYMATSDPKFGLLISCIVTGVILFLFGGFKTYFTYAQFYILQVVMLILKRRGAAGGFKGYLYGAVSMAIVGGLAAGAAYGLVKVMHIKE